MEREYIAFISYRHKPLDMDVARKLHRLIEHYRIPKDLKKDGSSRLGYVFRDRDELPLSSDLSADIRNALDRSRFLIVICTPDTPESPWVRLEIEYFLQHHKREHVLAVLADGTPEQAFPEQITHIYEQDGVTLNRLVEPLAANIVSSSRLKRNRLIREEFLRLAAAIQECPYDMLRQREKRYRQQQISMIAGAVAAVALGFIVLLLQRNWEIQKKNEEVLAMNQEIQTKNEEIQAKNEEIQIQLEQSLRNESSALALLSAQLLEEGDRTGAVENALKALPSAAQERPESIEAELALCNALYAYQDEGMRAACRIEQETEIKKLAVSEDGCYIATLDTYDHMRCFDGYTGKMLWKKEVSSWNADCFTIVESAQAIFYAYSGRETVLLSLRDGSVLNELALEKPDSRYYYRIFISDTEDVMAAWGLSSKGPAVISFYRLSDFGQISEGSLSSVPGYIEYESFSPDGTRHAAIFRDERDDVYHYTLYVFDVDTGSLLYQKPLAPYQGTSDAAMVFLPDGDLMVLRSNSYPDTQYLYRLEKDTGETVYSRSFSEECWTGSTPSLLLNENMLVYARWDSVLIFELGSGNLMEHQKLPSYCEACYFLDDNRDRYVAVLSNGKVVTDSLPNYDVNIKLARGERMNFQMPCSVSKAYGNNGPSGYICVLPEDDGYHALVYHSLGDEEKTGLQVPLLTHFDQLLKRPSGDMYLSPSGDKAVYVSGDSDKAPRPYTVIVYDTESMEEKARYEFTYDGILAMTGFSRDESRLIFSYGVLDLEAETWTPYTAPGNLSLIRLRFQEPYIQQPGTSTKAALFKDEDYDGSCVLQWWEDGEKAGESACPYKGEIDSGRYQQSIAIGESGLIGIALQGKGYAIYSREKDAWAYMEDPCEEGSVPTFCAGNQNPWLAFCGSDGFLRIIDGETGEAVRTFPLEITADAVSGMQFLLEDSVLLMVQNYNQLCFLDTDDGTVKIRLELDGLTQYSDLSLQLDEAGGNLYIGERNGGIEGVCIDLSTWKVRRRIPGLAGFASGSHRIIKLEDRIDNEGAYVSYPAYTLEELIKKGEKLLSR